MPIPKMLQGMRGGLVVSCQALDGEPLHHPGTMALMALAAKNGGGVAIRANGCEDIAEIKSAVPLPVIGLKKRCYPDSPVYITPTMDELIEVGNAGADIIAIDATVRKRPQGATVDELVHTARELFPDALLMADISNFNEAQNAYDCGFDIISTTLSGYTPNSPKLHGPDFELVKRLVLHFSKKKAIPIFAEGRIRFPEQAGKLIESGAWAVVVGSAITRPQFITGDFVSEISDRLYKSQSGRCLPHV